MVTIEDRVDGLALEGSQGPPPERVDDVMLDGGVEPVERILGRPGMRAGGWIAMVDWALGVRIGRASDDGRSRRQFEVDVDAPRGAGVALVVG